jgi:cytoskeletal protein RodZ
MNRNLTSAIVVAIVLLISASYVYVNNNPIEINIQATIGSTQISTTTSTTTTTTIPKTTSSSSTSTTSSSSTSTTTTTTSSTTTTTIPTTTTTIEVSEKDDSVTINTNSEEDIEIYEGEYTLFDGFEGDNQFKLDALVATLPEELRKSVENNVIFVNGCHSYAAQILDRCPFGRLGFSRNFCGWYN